ncbi:hypothetical protein EDWATA_03864 [Edwardsiella tarda ATCC 23685]|uniref:Uncharacterized protein n=1 Tax=Edwardsiella tarda ATCC 23685 TaxID=500638 RepID=D4FAP3_EDWTA|nr:hypothetical protein EDWATA_03864 [Edwardsiella tarda ATCC 23685]
MVLGSMWVIALGGYFLYDSPPLISFCIKPNFINHAWCLAEEGRIATRP